MDYRNYSRGSIKKNVKSVIFSTSILVGALLGGSNVLADIDYAFVATSDPQYPWTAKTDAQVSQSDSEKNAESQWLILNQYNSINDYSRSIGNKVIHTHINGDVTAYGHDWQWNKMEQLFQTLKMPYSYGLGNHDIENNYGDTLFDNAWQLSFKKMYNFNPYYQISKDTWIESYPFQYKFVGSLDYSQRIGDFRMITANNYPTMSNSSTKGEYVYWLTSGMNYIEKQLEEAKNANQPAILYIHKPNDWKWGNDSEGKFKSIIEKYYNNGTLRAIFTGHYHYNLGKVSYPEYFGNVPIYSSGSASQKSYLTAEVDHSKNEMKIYKVVGNVWENKQLIDTIAINARGITTVNDATDYSQQKDLVNRVGSSYHLINSLNNSRVLDDSAESDDLIYFHETGATNQQWKFVFSDTKNCFTIKNRANNFLMYESDNKWNGFSQLRTGSLSTSDSRAQWRVVSAGSAYGTIPLYKFRNVRSGKILTLNAYSGKLNDAGIGGTLITSPDFGTTDLQKFMLD
ncbi:hypothetical protein A5844_001552 [Enterococcus sp. 10A9_DIV0425]|uniref:Ricin B lectin domain-containing protein n=1 Tax=Candidatus Enterococcus wittei TaxID=1987383 RepID=A0A242K181_9ENTE|nr:RICIN domain-containing protein [Enterococcus sp. 10A9_DIV0425]OTP11417.1 hypothetical protein A5844_001552 [Enterococcus sp. 10A9_DIV0425]THE07659.1 hypothetical protein E1H99_12280 [Enterococcus hirae]